MGMKVLAEQVAQIQHKLDAVIRHFKIKVSPVHFVGEQCPLCLRPVDYKIDPFVNVVERKCGCSTGKMPSTIQLTPIGDNSAKPSLITDDRSGNENSESSATSPTRPNKLRR